LGWFWQVTALPLVPCHVSMPGPFFSSCDEGFFFFLFRLLTFHPRKRPFLPPPARNPFSPFFFPAPRRRWIFPPPVCFDRKAVPPTFFPFFFAVFATWLDSFPFSLQSRRFFSLWNKSRGHLFPSPLYGNAIRVDLFFFFFRARKIFFFSPS